MHGQISSILISLSSYSPLVNGALPKNLECEAFISCPRVVEGADPYRCLWKKRRITLRMEHAQLEIAKKLLSLIVPQEANFVNRKETFSHTFSVKQ